MFLILASSLNFCVDKQNLGNFFKLRFLSSLFQKFVSQSDYTFKIQAPQ